MSAPHYHWFHPEFLGDAQLPALADNKIRQLVALWRQALPLPTLRTDWRRWVQQYAQTGRTDGAAVNAQRPPLIILDQLAEPHPLAQQLARVLSYHGVDVIYVQSNSQGQSWQYQGRKQGWRDWEALRKHAALLIFLPQCAAKARAQLYSWTHYACLNTRIIQAGLNYYPAQLDSLIALFRHWFAGSEAPPSLLPYQGLDLQPTQRLSLSAQLERLLGKRLSWAQACAMLPPPLSPALAERIRTQFYPQLGAECIDTLRHLAQPDKGPGLVFDLAVLAALRAGFARQAEPRQLDILRFLLAEIDAARPAPSSAAELEWQWYRQRLALELEPDNALPKLLKLGQLPELQQLVQQDLATVCLPGNALIPQHHVPLRRSPKQRANLLLLQKFAPACLIANQTISPVKHQWQLRREDWRWRSEKAVAMFANQGQHILSATPERAWVWQVSDGELLYSLDAQAQRPLEEKPSGANLSRLCATFSPAEDQIVTLLNDQRLCLWDKDSLTLHTIFHTAQMRVRSLLFLPHSLHVLAVTAEGQVWDVAQGRVLFTLTGHRDALTRACLSHDGRYIASAARDASVRLWEAYSGEPVACLQGHRKAVLDLAFSADDRYLLSGSADRHASLWDMQSRQRLAEFGPHQAAVCQVCFSPSGRWLASATEDGKIQVWEREKASCLQTIKAHRGRVNSLSFSPDSRHLLSAGDDGEVRVWEALLR